MARRSLIPYLNERNVPKNVFLQELTFDQPDPESFPIAAAPGNHLFVNSGSYQNKIPNTKLVSKFETFDGQNIEVFDKKNVFLDSNNTAEKDFESSKNYFEMYRSEHSRRLQLSQEVIELKNKLALNKVNIFFHFLNKIYLEKITNIYKKFYFYF